MAGGVLDRSDGQEVRGPVEVCATRRLRQTQADQRHRESGAGRGSARRDARHPPQPHSQSSGAGPGRYSRDARPRHRTRRRPQRGQGPPTSRQRGALTSSAGCTPRVRGCPATARGEGHQEAERSSTRGDATRPIARRTSSEAQRRREAGDRREGFSPRAQVAQQYPIRGWDVGSSWREGGRGAAVHRHRHEHQRSHDCSVRHTTQASRPRRRVTGERGERAAGRHSRGTGGTSPAGGR